MYNPIKLLQEILEESKMQTKLLAKIAGVPEESLEELRITSVNFSDATVVKSVSEEEIIKEENIGIEDRIRERFDIIQKERIGTQFYEEEEVSDIAEGINEG